MKRPDFEVHFELEGWELFFAALERGAAESSALAGLRASVAQRVRAELELESLSQQPAIAGLRRLFKQAGTDPARYRPSSEALVRRLLKGEELPAIHPLVDLNNCLSARLLVPCCVMAEGSFSPPFVFRAGEAGESYESLRGPFRLEGKPLLLDSQGPCDAPITGSERVKLTESTGRATLVAYLPRGVVAPGSALEELEALLRAAPVATLLDARAAN
jgi:DNA/RNA-binding domain of Phe-tRNA-synthetase-like protein